MGIALRRVAIDESERERLMGERDQEDDAHDRMHGCEVRLGGMNDQGDGEPAPPQGDVCGRVVHPQPSRRLLPPRRYQHDAKL